MLYKKSREFIYRNARPLALAMWKYHFENGSKEAVLEALSFYQNEDGGFGHAIEADFWNPNSTPIGTWRATVYLASIGGIEKSHPMVQGILNYLDSGDGFDEKSGQWLFTVPSNNNYPHAIWWENDGKEQAFSPNPTAALAGFILAYADKDSSVYQKGCEAAVHCYQHMIEKFPITDMNSVPCYISLYQYCIQGGVTELFDMEKFKDCLLAMVNGAICHETDKWGKEYVALPSNFIDGPNSLFYAGNEELVKAECAQIKEQQLEDGSFTVPWQWWTEYKEFEVAKVWWKAEMIMEKLLCLRNFSELEEI
ncbi:MAG: hypothetical protein J6K04_02130 [Lachnospiraceae bacterium]|nr:hypothetical protein [Lachnospiraceae bacterium]